MANIPRPNPILGFLATGIDAKNKADQESLEKQKIKAQVMTAGMDALSSGLMRATLAPFNIEQSRRMAGIQKNEDLMLQARMPAVVQDTRTKMIKGRAEEGAWRRFVEKGGDVSTGDNMLIKNSLEQSKYENARALEYARKREGVPDKTAELEKKKIETSLLEEEMKVIESGIAIEIISSKETFKITDPTTKDFFKDAEGNYIEATYADWKKSMFREDMALTAAQQRAIISEIGTRIRTGNLSNQFLEESMDTKLAILEQNKSLGAEQLTTLRQELKRLKTETDMKVQANKLMLEAFDPTTGELRPDGLTKIDASRTMLMKSDPRRSVQQQMEDQYTILLDDGSSTEEKALARKKIQQYQFDSNKSMQEFEMRVMIASGLANDWVNPEVVRWVSSLDQNDREDWIMHGQQSRAFNSFGRSGSGAGSSQDSFFHVNKNIRFGSVVKNNQTGETTFTTNDSYTYEPQGKGDAEFPTSGQDIVDRLKFDSVKEGRSVYTKEELDGRRKGATPYAIKGIRFGASERFLNSLHTPQMSQGILDESSQWLSLGNYGDKGDGVAANMAAVVFRDYISSDGKGGKMDQYFNAISSAPFAIDEETGEFIVKDKDLKTLPRDILAKNLTHEMVTSRSFNHPEQQRLGWKRNSTVEGLLSVGLRTLFNSLYLTSPDNKGSSRLVREKFVKLVSREADTGKDTNWLGLTTDEINRLITAFDREAHNETNQFMDKFVQFSHLSLHQDVGGATIGEGNLKLGALLDERKKILNQSPSESSTPAVNTDITPAINQGQEVTRPVPSVPIVPQQQVEEETEVLPPAQTFFPGFTGEEEQGLTPPPGAIRESTDLTEVQGPEPAISAAETEEIEGLEKNLAQFITMRDALIDRYKGDPNALRGTMPAHMYGIDDKIKDLEDRIEVLKKRSYKKAS